MPDDNLKTNNTSPATPQFTPFSPPPSPSNPIQNQPQAPVVSDTTPFIPPSPISNPMPQQSTLSTPPIIDETNKQPLTPFTPTPAPEATIENISFSPAKEKKKSKKKLLFGLFLLIILLFIASTTILSYMLTYEKIKIDNDVFNKVQNSVSKIVLDLPFTPKTPSYVLTKAVNNQENITSHSFDLSAAVTAYGLTEVIGSNKLDVQVKGDVDYSNSDDIKFNLNVSLSKDLNFDFMKVADMLYFKINTLNLPPYFSAIMGTSLDPASLEIYKNKWFSYDLGVLNTPARQRANQSKPQKSITKEISDNILYVLNNPDVKDSLKIEKSEGNYKITLNSTDQLTDTIFDLIEKKNNIKSEKYDTYEDRTKPSDIYKNLSLEAIIAKDYKVSKLTISFDVDLNGSSSVSGGIPFLSSSRNRISVVTVLSLSDINSGANFTPPQDSQTFEEFIQGIYSVSTVPTRQMAQARDAQRKADLQSLRSALEMYAADNKGIYPSSLQSLSPDYVASVPKDPNGGSYYYRMVNNKYDICANLEVTTSSVSTCPDSTYNYHVENP